MITIHKIAFFCFFASMLLAFGIGAYATSGVDALLGIPGDVSWTMIRISVFILRPIYCFWLFDAILVTLILPSQAVLLNRAMRLRQEGITWDAAFRQAKAESEPDDKRSALHFRIVGLCIVGVFVIGMCVINGAT